MQDKAVIQDKEGGANRINQPANETTRQDSDIEGSLPGHYNATGALVETVTGKIKERVIELQDEGINVAGLDDAAIQKIASQLLASLKSTVLENSPRFFADKAEELFAAVNYEAAKGEALYLVGPPDSKIIICLLIEEKDKMSFLKVRQDFPYRPSTEFRYCRDTGEVFGKSEDHLVMLDRAMTLAGDPKRTTDKSPVHFP